MERRGKASKGTASRRAAGHRMAMPGKAHHGMGILKEVQG